MTTEAVALSRLQAGVLQWMETIPSASAFWAPSGYPRAATGALRLEARLLAPPYSTAIGRPYGRLIPHEIRYRVLAATAGESAKIFAAGIGWEHVIAGGETVTDVRDALLNLVQADIDLGILHAEVEADGADVIVATPIELGDLYAANARGSVTGLVEVQSQATTFCEVALSQARSYVEVQAYSTEQLPHAGAHAALTRLLARRRLRPTLRIFERFGLAILDEPQAPVGLDSLAGPDWQSRAAVSLYVGQTLIAAEAADRIERARVTLDVRGSVPDTAIAVDTDDAP